MNRYGRMAYEHWRRHPVAGTASMADPTEHFSRVGEEIQARITQLRDELLGLPRTREDPEGYRHRAYQTRAQAEEIVLAETFSLPAPEAPTASEDEAERAYRAGLTAASVTLAGLDRSWTQDTSEDRPAP